MNDAPLHLDLPKTWSAVQRRGFLGWAERAANGDGPGPVPKTANSSLAAAYAVVADLASQGWRLTVDGTGLSVAPALVNEDVVVERDRVRAQELLKRDEQLGRESVRRFIRRMETPRQHGGEFVSIFSLMRDGADLADSIREARTSSNGETDFDLAAVVAPYVQIVAAGQRCAETGLLLTDIWRYFRHTWTNQHTSTPGRTMMILIRDAAAPFHPVIGIAALGSSVVQLKQRDQWIGWQRDQFLAETTSRPSLRLARWLWRRLEDQRDELHLVDLVRDGLYWPQLWDDPTQDAIAKLEAEAARCRAEHHRFASPRDFKTALDATDPDALPRRAETPLFRSKRCLALAGLLRSRSALLPFFKTGPSRASLEAALQDRHAREAVASIVRRAKADAVGTEMADLTVCGSIAPYSDLLGGKLVAMLAVSPTVVRAYHERYGEYAGEIASSMAGRPIVRRNRLAFIGTTSLYGSQSSQYNRLSMPGHVLGGSEPLEFKRLGRSQSFGTSHLSDRSVEALVRLAEQTAGGVRVNSIFGEGVNPKLRKVRHGLDLLGWPSDELLQHGRQRIIYGVSLTTNLLPYLIGLDESPAYRFRTNAANDTAKIVAWWRVRWSTRRLASPEALMRVADHGTVERPIAHGARVQLPADQSED
jgi:hypothetical protein